MVIFILAISLFLLGACVVFVFVLKTYPPSCDDELHIFETQGQTDEGTKGVWAVRQFAVLLASQSDIDSHKPLPKVPFFKIKKTFPRPWYSSSMHMQRQLTTPLLTRDVDWTSIDLEPQLSQVLHERPHGLEIGGCISSGMSTSRSASDLFSLEHPRA
ncbi:hypothetical protein B0H14DRAFT_3160616, partial [Mycena olivaceomarginata]